MPKCLDCSNIKFFTYEENSYNEAEYDDNGELLDVSYKEYEKPINGKCKLCDSSNVQGDL